ncbi:UNVERIFIED_CONTAM: hypothetical protein GTU68_012076 [Idotea baltica]|nr:hypothetical protein [Idotea baltica]
MRAVLQRVKHASVTIENQIYSRIDSGILILLGIMEDDNKEDIEWLVKKIINMRIFGDAEGKMNYSVLDNNASLMVVSQFTLYGSTKKGNRPSFIKAAKPDTAIPLYDQFIQHCKDSSGLNVQTGSFGADMKLDLLNDGPVTIIIDSKIRE